MSRLAGAGNGMKEAGMAARSTGRLARRPESSRSHAGCLAWIYPTGVGREQDPPQPSGIPRFSNPIPVQRIPWAQRVGDSEEPPQHLPIPGPAPASPGAESRQIIRNIVAVARGSCIQEQAVSCLECSGSSAMGTFFPGVVWVAVPALLRTGSSGSQVFSFPSQEIHLGCGLLDTKCSRGSVG